jgi:fructose-bisphosphate aldolase, class II
MFVTKPRLFLKYVFENRFAVPSFNVSNLEMARAVVEAAVIEDAPVMIQTDFINFNYGGMAELYALVRTLAEPVNVPVMLHQDHPGEDHNIIRSLRRGYYSVMYDGGHLALAENIRETARFAEIVHAAGANLESEIGLFGGEYQGGTLAVSVGSEHGHSSRLDLQLLGDIAENTRIPLVLHGGSGIDPEDAKAATKLNVYKINIGAALINGFVEGMAEGAELAPDHEPKHQRILRHVIAKLRDIARSRLSLFGASGHGKKLLVQLDTAQADVSEKVQR